MPHPLKSDDLNHLLENHPAAMRAVASVKGVNLGDLRRLAHEGLLDSVELLKILAALLERQLCSSSAVPKRQITTDDLQDLPHLVVLKPSHGSPQLFPYEGPGCMERAHEFAQKLSLEWHDGTVEVAMRYRRITGSAAVHPPTRSSRG
jgi:hypothetical protein